MWPHILLVFVKEKIITLSNRFQQSNESADTHNFAYREKKKKKLLM